jgi:hypothetical protein
MKKYLTVFYEIETEDYKDLMESENLSLEEAVGQLLDDGDLELNELPIYEWEISEGKKNIILD